jgi:hypothetical protein
LQPVRKKTHGDNKENVRQLMTIQPFGCRMRLQGPGRSWPEEEAATKQQDPGPHGILVSGLEGHFISTSISFSALTLAHT